jgi:hypothetical protein
VRLLTQDSKGPDAAWYAAGSRSVTAEGLALLRGANFLQPELAGLATIAGNVATLAFLAELPGFSKSLFGLPDLVRFTCCLFVMLSESLVASRTAGHL